MKALSGFVRGWLLFPVMAIVVFGAALVPAQGQDPATLKTLKEALTLHASYNRGLDADVAKGDPRLFTATSRRGNWTSKAGNHTDQATRIAKDKGLTGHALEFTKRKAPWLFYESKGNLPYQKKNWSGSVSFWLKLDPEEDLEPGYCDPIQITTRAWNDASFFVDFDKAGDPRDFRLGAFADLQVWKPADKKVNDIPENQRPLLMVRNPPFGRDRWTHVAFTWSRFNTGKKDGVSTLYLNGKSQGDVRGWDQTFTWKDSETSRILIGLNYIGLFDDLTCFNRQLSAKEIQALYQLKGKPLP